MQNNHVQPKQPVALDVHNKQQTNTQKSTKNKSRTSRDEKVSGSRWPYLVIHSATFFCSSFFSFPLKNGWPLPSSPSLYNLSKRSLKKIPLKLHEYPHQISPLFLSSLASHYPLYCAPFRQCVTLQTTTMGESCSLPLAHAAGSRHQEGVLYSSKALPAPPGGEKASFSCYIKIPQNITAFGFLKRGSTIMFDFSYI